MNNLFRKKRSAESSKNSGFKESPVDAPNREAINVRTSEFEIDKARDSWGLSMQVKKVLITIAVVVGCLLIFKYFIAGEGAAAESSSIQKNTELESVENKIIIGLDGQRNKAQLLNLVSQLNHTDADNFIDGKKQGIIASDIHGPDDEFFGTYAEYWTGLREGYKEIITRDLTIESYKEELRSKQTTLQDTLK
ncbi:MAG: hypothetical protein LW688_06000 [Cryomorphaceae bacterium]|jgi:hypothetical protein|nr:hypothetical protein [Cryomorphaceae bacterium]